MQPDTSRAVRNTTAKMRAVANFGDKGGTDALLAKVAVRKRELNPKRKRREKFKKRKVKKNLAAGMTVVENSRGKQKGGPET